MKKLFFIVPVIMIVGLTVCLKPARDNVYDPNNPNKAKICGIVYGLNDLPVRNAEVFLMQDTEVTDTTTTGDDGYYEIGGIDPGIYKLVARAPYYVSWECEPESLPAYADDTIDIWFCAQYYDFENEATGTVQPFGFDTICGTWAVINDGSGPEHHSTPNVYHGEKTAAGPTLALLKNSGSDFHLETKFRVLNSSGSGWLTGAVFGYHGDALNFYFVGVTHLGITLNKRINGVDSTLRFITNPFMLETWYDLTVQMCGQNITVYADGEEMNYTDSLPYSGKAGLWVENPGGQALVNFDDVIIDR